MIPYNYTEFSSILNDLVQKNYIPMSRIDDAVRRILRVKFISGVFESPYADTSLANKLGSKVLNLICYQINYFNQINI